MTRNWKADIIILTEHPESRRLKIDASFFPPVGEGNLTAWESGHGLRLPEDLRSFVLCSDGLEAQRGEMWPVLPLKHWDVLRDECVGPQPMVRFGESAGRRYFFLAESSGPDAAPASALIRRHELHGSEDEFFAASFRRYLELVFEGRA